MTDLAEFDRHRSVSLATFRRSGAEVRTPVWFAAADGRLYVFTAGESGKVKRLRHSSRARGPLGCARASHRRVSAGERAHPERTPLDRAVRAALRAKYGRQMWLGDLFSRLAGRINRRAWPEIQL